MEKGRKWDKCSAGAQKKKKEEAKNYEHIG